MSFSDIVEGIVEKLFGGGDKGMSYHLQSLKKTLTTNDWTIMKDGAPLSEVRCLTEKERKKAEKIAIDILIGKTRGVNLFAIEVLGELKSKPAFPYLKTYLRTAEGHTSAVASALYQIDRSHEWLEILLQELKNPDKERRRSAVGTLAEINTPEASDACFSIIAEDMDYEVRWSAYLSLCRKFEGKNWHSAHKEIIKTFPICSEEEDFRKQAAEMLRKKWGCQ